MCDGWRSVSQLVLVFVPGDDVCACFELLPLVLIRRRLQQQCAVWFWVLVLLAAFQGSSGAFVCCCLVYVQHTVGVCQQSCVVVVQPAASYTSTLLDGCFVVCITTRICICCVSFFMSCVFCCCVRSNEQCTITHTLSLLPHPTDTHDISHNDVG